MRTEVHLSHDRPRHSTPPPVSHMLLHAHAATTRRYGWVIHGGIDGYSRFLVWLRAVNHNRASVPRELFRDAVLRWGAWRNIRADFGGENIGVKRLVAKIDAAGQPSVYIAARSVHNQRIERYWREFYYVRMGIERLLSAIEEDGLLDTRNKIHRSPSTRSTCHSSTNFVTKKFLGITRRSYVP